MFCFDHSTIYLNTCRPFSLHALRTHSGYYVCNIFSTVMLLLRGLPSGCDQPPREEVMNQDRPKAGVWLVCNQSVCGLRPKGGDMHVKRRMSCAASQSPKQGTNGCIHVAVIAWISQNKVAEYRPHPNTRSSNFTRFGGLRKPSRRNETPEVCREELPWSLVRFSKRVVASGHRRPTSISTGTD